VTDVFLMSAHTAIGSFGGALKDQRPGELAAHVSKAAIERAGIAPMRCRALFSVT
jgi:acetyl-CoA C-acetyltransferase